MVEEMGATAQVLEKLLPTFFSGFTELYSGADFKGGYKLAQAILVPIEPHQWLHTSGN